MVLTLDLKMKFYIGKKLKFKGSIMVKKLKPKGKIVKGSKYVEADEEYDKKTRKQEDKGMKTAGVSKELKLSEKEQGYSKKPRVKPQKKNMKPVSGQKKIGV